MYCQHSPLTNKPRENAEGGFINRERDSLTIPVLNKQQKQSGDSSEHEAWTATVETKSFTSQTAPRCLTPPEGAQRPSTPCWGRARRLSGSRPPGTQPSWLWRLPTRSRSAFTSVSPTSVTSVKLPFHSLTAWGIFFIISPMRPFRLPSVEKRA